MPTADTFDCPPIGGFVKRYLREADVSVDPFARNKRWATYTNDLNTETAAEYHLDVLDFLQMLRARDLRADLGIFDPPYSRQQVKEHYLQNGLDFGAKDTQRMTGWKAERDILDAILGPGAYVLTFGWNSQGMGTERGYKLEEIVLVCHGAGHNDTICIAERKLAHQPHLF
jgi:hypothetical protein